MGWWRIERRVNQSDKNTWREEAGHRGARRASRLLERPDRLIGLIFLGNDSVNIAASSLATVLALRLLAEAGIALAAGLLTL